MSISRRRFLETMAGGAALLSVQAAVADDQPSQPLIIDTHQHLWDRARLNLPWLAGAAPVLQKNYGPAEYRAAMRGLNIRAIYMEVDVADGEHDKEADDVSALCREGKELTIAAVIGGRPAGPEFAAYVDRHRDQGIVQGVRQVLHGASTPRGYCLKAEFVSGIRVLGQRGLSFDLCMRPDELADGVRLAELCPETRLIVDHCGNADPKVFAPARPNGPPPSHSADEWKQSMEKLAARPNVICKISGVVAKAPENWTAGDLAPPVNFCLDAFGAERVVFGSDWPVCLLGAQPADWIAALREIVSERPAADQTKLWSTNALRLYRLNLA